MRLDINNNKGITDIPLSGNPQITYFSNVYRRHTNFAIKRDKIESTLPSHNISINHMGDLLKSIDLEIDITKNESSIPANLGTSILNEITISTNGKEFEKLSGSYIEMYMELKNPKGVNTFYVVNDSKITCNEGTMEQILSLSGGVFNANTVNTSKINIILPIPFSFSNNIGSALPYFLFHLNKKLEINFNVNNNLEFVNNNIGKIEYSLIIYHIILSNEERNRFEVSQNEYLFEKIYIQNINVNSTRSYPIEPIYGNIKSIMWKNEWTKNYKYNILINRRRLFNNNMSYHYFTRHTILNSGYPGGGNSYMDAPWYHGPAEQIVKNDDSIAFYSFALNDYMDSGEDSSTPSGSISSNKNEIILIIDGEQTLKKGNIDLYIKAYNIMHITEGYFKLEYIH